jgi:hypothetical protein
MEYTISSVFAKDHVEINDELDHLDALCERSNEEFLPVYQKFRWHLQKHFYIEEKALWTYCDMEKKFDQDMINELLNDHDFLIEFFNRVEITELSECKFILSEFIAKIINHVAYETENFYKVLDEELEANEKAMVIDIINKDSRLGYYPINKIREFGQKILKDNHISWDI